MVRCPILVLEWKRWGQRSGLGLPGLPPRPTFLRPHGLRSRPHRWPHPPLSPGFRVSLEASPEVGEFPQLPPGWAQTSPLPEVLSLRSSP